MEGFLNLAGKRAIFGGDFDTFHTWVLSKLMEILLKIALENLSNEKRTHCE